MTSDARYSDTIKRASAVFSDSWYVNELLKAMRDERNEYVHSDRDIDQSELLAYQLKSVIEVLFEFWIGTASRFEKREDMLAFLDLPLDIGVLAFRRKLLDLAINFRGR